MPRRIADKDRQPGRGRPDNEHAQEYESAARSRKVGRSQKPTVTTEKGTEAGGHGLKHSNSRNTNRERSTKKNCQVGERWQHTIAETRHLPKANKACKGNTRRYSDQSRPITVRRATCGRASQAGEADQRFAGHRQPSVEKATPPIQAIGLRDRVNPRLQGGVGGRCEGGR